MTYLYESNECFKKEVRGIPEAKRRCFVSVKGNENEIFSGFLSSCFTFTSLRRHTNEYDTYIKKFVVTSEFLASRFSGLREATPILFSICLYHTSPNI